MKPISCWQIITYIATVTWYQLSVLQAGVYYFRYVTSLLSSHIWSAWCKLSVHNQRITFPVLNMLGPQVISHTNKIVSSLCSTVLKEKQDATLSQRWPRDASYSLYGCSENFWEFLHSYAHLIFPTFLMDFCSDRYRDCAYKIWSSYLYPLLR